MTITTQTFRAQYNGNGVTVNFSIPFEFIDQTGVKVIHTDADGVDTTWVHGTQYNITNNDGTPIVNRVQPATGKVVVVTAPTDYTPATGTRLTILRNEPFTQAASYTEQGPFPAKAHERALDRLDMQIHTLREMIDRAPKYSETSTTIAPTFPQPEAGKIIGWNDDGDALENKALTDLQDGLYEVVDEDDMASDSATKVPTQQSVKAYADTKVAIAATDASGFGFVIDEDNMASDSDEKVPTQQSVKAYVDANSGDIVEVADRTALKALDTTKDDLAYLTEAGREGVFKWDASDISASIIGSDIASTSVASSTITSADHGLDTGMAVLVAAAVNGLSTGTFYYAIRVDADNFKLASSYANAVAGTNVTLTGTAATTVNQHFDPLEGIYVTPTSDKTGASGAWVRVRDTEIVPVKWFGALADNTTNDSPAIQAAWNYVVSVGGVLLLSRGRHLIVQTLNFYTNIQSGSDMRRVSIRGHGAGATALVFQGTLGTVDAVRWGCQEDAISGQNNLHGYVTHGGFSIECADLANNGFHAFRQAWFRLEDIEIGSPRLSGFNFESCVSFSVLRLKATGGTGGILMQKGTDALAFTSPNAISIIDCTFGASTLGGIRLFDPGPVTVIGGSVESCGTHGTATSGGITVSVTATSTNISATALNVVGTYFEGNGGGADILVQNNDDRPVAVTVIGANFNRTLDTKYVTNNICLNHTGTGLMTLGVRGCGFASVSPYVPDAARKAIGLIGTAATYKNIEISSDNAFQNSVERPDDLNGPWGLPNLWAEAYVRASSAGAVVSAMSHNIASVAKNSTGDYTITYNYAMRDTTNCYSGMIVGGAGYVSVYGETASTVSIRTRTDAGVLTDLAFSLHIKGRHP